MTRALPARRIAIADPLARAERRWTWRKRFMKPRATRRPERFPALDNARFVLITLVVIGHLMEQLVDTGPVAAAMYRWIYLFHMPAFILISGALSKPSLNRRRILAMVERLLLPYLVFQTLYGAWDGWLFQGSDWSQGYLTPYWLLWYLPSLMCWRLLLPAFARLGRWGLPLALALALAAGTAGWIGYPGSLSRTLAFFPLFLLGYRLGPAALQRLGGHRTAACAAAAVLALAAAGAWWLRDADPRWLYESYDYASLGTTAAAGALVRLALLLAAAACALAVLGLVPRQPRWNGAGRRSLDIYLLHGFLVRAALAAGAFAWLATVLPAPGQLLACIGTGILISAALSTQWVEGMALPWLQPVAALARLRGQAPRPAPAIRARME